MRYADSEHTARKRFGQNFLSDGNIIDKIVAAINPKPGQRMVEIGPGLGALTGPVLAKAGALEVVELDRDLIPLLQRQFADKALTIHEADALKFDFGSLCHDKKIRVIGNLPYNISTPILFHLLNYRQGISDMHFMLQKEVVERMVAVPSTKDYGRLSVMLQYHCQVDGLFMVPPRCFQPAPKVDSMIVRLVPYAEPPYPVKNLEQFEALVKQAFGQRRKTLANNLKPYFNKTQLQALGMDPELRPENLTVQQYVALANAL
jgi:16S rRNA (adenine1518-N6/adenine1519-N6)-dimethyltransferase